MSSLTEEELHVLEDIFQALLQYHIGRIATRDAKNRAIKELGSQKQGQKSLTTTYAYHLISEMINRENNNINGEAGNEGGLPAPFMPRDLRSRLPEDLRNIAPASLTRILDRVAQVAPIERMEGEPQNRSRRPSALSEDFGGRRSYYYPMKTREDDKVAKLLTKPDAQRWLNRRIVKSGLLLEHAKYYALVNYYEIRQDLHKMIKTVEPHINRVEDKTRIDSLSRADYEHMLELDDNQLEEEAERKAQEYVEKHENDPDLFLRMMYGISITARDSLESQAE